MVVPTLTFERIPFRVEEIRKAGKGNKLLWRDATVSPMCDYLYGNKNLPV